MSVTYGPMSQQPFTYYDPGSSSLRTCQGTFPLDLIESSPTLPRSGSMRNGELFGHPMSVPRTGGSVYSSSPGLLPTPHANASTGAGRQGREGGINLQTALLPTPAARDGKGRDMPGRTGGAGLPTVLLPTPTSQAAKHGSTPDTTAKGYGSNLWDLPHLLPTPKASDGRYGQAIARWEEALGRPAPAPTDGQRLSPAFVEWMMGLPAGWVTDVPGVSRTHALKILGNGVVPQQAAHALQLLGARHG